MIRTDASVKKFLKGVYLWKMIYSAITSVKMMALNQNLELIVIVLNILKNKYCVNKSGDMSRDHFAKNRKLLTNWWPV